MTSAGESLPASSSSGFRACLVRSFSVFRKSGPTRWGMPFGFRVSRQQPWPFSAHTWAARPESARTPMSLRQRLTERAARVGFALSDDEVAKLSLYLRSLQHWNEAINLTGLPLEGFPSQTIDRLIAEPLAAAEFVRNEPRSWIDLGSGGGSPAIPLKIVRPRLALTMVESRSRRAAFLREVVRAIDLTNAAVLTARLEELAEMAPRSADLVSARGVRIDRQSAHSRPGGDAARWATCPFSREAKSPGRTKGAPPGARKRTASGRNASGLGETLNSSTASWARGCSTWNTSGERRNWRRYDHARRTSLSFNAPQR